MGDIMVFPHPGKPFVKTTGPAMWGSRTTLVTLPDNDPIDGPSAFQNEARVHPEEKRARRGTPRAWADHTVIPSKSERRIVYSSY